MEVRAFARPIKANTEEDAKPPRPRPCRVSRLRRILPKGCSDFDALDAVDVAAVRSHVNSYPRPAREGKCPYDLAAPELPAELLGNLGIVKVPADDVLLRPALVARAVEL